MIQNSLESLLLISAGCASAPACRRPGVNGDWRSLQGEEVIYDKSKIIRNLFPLLFVEQIL